MGHTECSPSSCGAYEYVCADGAVLIEVASRGTVEWQSPATRRSDGSANIAAAQRCGNRQVGVQTMSEASSDIVRVLALS